MECSKCKIKLNSIENQNDILTAYFSEWRRINNKDFCAKCIDDYFQEVLERTHEYQFKDGPGL